VEHHVKVLMTGRRASLSGVWYKGKGEITPHLKNSLFYMRICVLNGFVLTRFVDSLL
jgi:hypothetical protein